MRIYIYFIGRPRDEHANAIAAEYLKRTSAYARCEMREVNPDKFDPFEKHPPAQKVLLDPAGRQLDSAQFAKLLQKAEDVGRDIVFVLGGHDGLPPTWRPKADLLLSMSSMTWPHELARAMLTEQVYRGFATLRGHPYPR